MSTSPNSFSNLKNLDYLSDDFAFEVNLQKKHKTWLGALLTVLIVIASGILIFLFGLELVHKKSPKQSTSKEFISNSRVNMTDLPFIFDFVSGIGRRFNNIKQYINPLLHNISIFKGGVAEFEDESYEFSQCTEANLRSLQGKIRQEEIDIFMTEGYYCFNVDNDDKDKFFVENNYGAINSTHVSFMFDICDKNSGICADDMDEVLNELYIYRIS